MPKREKRIAVCLVLVLISLLLANPGFGYDNLGNSARATGMGNAFVGLADDPSAIFYNPAGLARLKTWHLSLLYDKKSKYGLTDNENPFLASGVVVFPIRNNFWVGVSGCQRGSWSDPTQVVTNNIGQLSLSAQVNDQIALGFSGKFLYNSNFGKKKGADFDLGVLYQPIKSFSVGIAGENLLATDMRPEVSERSSLLGYSTRKGKVGLCYIYGIRDFLTKIVVDFVLKDVRQPMRKTYVQESFGIEHWIFNQKEMSFALRGGYTLGKDYGLDYKQPAFGCGLRYKGKEIIFQIDYSWQKYPYQPTERFAGDHRLSFTFSPATGKEISEVVKRESPLALKEKQKIGGPQKSITPDSEILKFGLNSKVVNVSTKRNKSVVFLLRPQIDLDIYEWKLYICSAKPPGWNEDQIEPYLVKRIKGKGMPGFGVVWDLGFKNWEVEKGKYFYALILVDREGQSWHSTWRSFRVKY
ncbi:MAG: OmpP1/FadL family transporter [Candidatus Zixiibacteriota bacterium]